LSIFISSQILNISFDIDYSTAPEGQRPDLIIILTSCVLLESMLIGKRLPDYQL
jgi:hypothetical protein